MGELRCPLLVHDNSLWMNCIGNLPFDPSIGAFVYYFPEGDDNSAAKSRDTGLSSQVKDKCENLYTCQKNSIEFLADAECQEVFAKIG